jgi:enoyl-CoA hydratase/carnithine racemase
MGELSADILIERDGPVEVVTLARPERLNTLSEAMTVTLRDYFGELSSRPDVRVVILKASGRAFCAGLDLTGWQQPQGATLALHTLRTQTLIGDILRRMRACPQPIIALGQGAACGGGFSLLLASDVRFGAPSLRMNAAYIKIGLGGADMASSYLLPRLVGSSIASELLLTGRFIAADRALRVGLLSDIVPENELFATGRALAEEMLLTAPYGLRLTKQALNLNIDAPSMEMAMAVEDRQQVLLSTSADHQEAIAAFLEKRLPVFTDN